MNEHPGLAWFGLAVGLVLAYEMARNLADVQRYLRMRRM
ncbi:DUF6893 family small protein [Streptomyces sp. FXJ1.172]|jgi:surfactin synthase thioesterase subunit